MRLDVNASKMPMVWSRFGGPIRAIDGPACVPGVFITRGRSGADAVVGSNRGPALVVCCRLVAGGAAAVAALGFHGVAPGRRSPEAACSASCRQRMIGCPREPRAVECAAKVASDIATTLVSKPGRPRATPHGAASTRQRARRHLVDRHLPARRRPIAPPWVTQALESTRRKTRHENRARRACLPSQPASCHPARALAPPSVHYDRGGPEERAVPAAPGAPRHRRHARTCALAQRRLQPAAGSSRRRAHCPCKAAWRAPRRNACQANAYEIPFPRQLRRVFQWVRRRRLCLARW